MECPIADINPFYGGVFMNGLSLMFSLWQFLNHHHTGREQLWSTESSRSWSWPTTEGNTWSSSSTPWTCEGFCTHSFNINVCSFPGRPWRQTVLCSSPAPSSAPLRSSRSVTASTSSTPSTRRWSPAPLTRSSRTWPGKTGTKQWNVSLIIAINSFRRSTQTLSYLFFNFNFMTNGLVWARRLYLPLKSRLLG